MRLKRGEPERIIAALGWNRKKFGLDLYIWLAMIVLSVLVFLLGFRIAAFVSFPVLLVFSQLAVRVHPEIFKLWAHGLVQKDHYDPRR
jgi:hypothetical protein